MTRYVWLHLPTGEFSNSWDEEAEIGRRQYDAPIQEGWKLIKYECLNDPTFQFLHLMVIK